MYKFPPHSVDHLTLDRHRGHALKTPTKREDVSHQVKRYETGVAREALPARPRPPLPPAREGAPRATRYGFPKVQRRRIYPRLLLACPPLPERSDPGDPCEILEGQVRIEQSSRPSKRTSATQCRVARIASLGMQDLQSEDARSHVDNA